MLKKLDQLYRNIKCRCMSINSERFPHYGGRGIKMDPRWQHSKESFIAWAIEHGYHPRLEIDRINNDGPYAPWNCRFVTRKENVHNSRATKLTDAEVKCIHAIHRDTSFTHQKIADIYGVSRPTITNILNGRTRQGA